MLLQYQAFLTAFHLHCKWKKLQWINYNESASNAHDHNNWKKNRFNQWKLWNFLNGSYGIMHFGKLFIRNNLQFACYITCVLYIWPMLVLPNFRSTAVKIQIWQYVLYFYLPILQVRNSPSYSTWWKSKLAWIPIVITNAQAEHSAQIDLLFCDSSKLQCASLQPTIFALN